MNIKEFLFEKHLTWTMTTNGYKFYTYNLYTSLLSSKVPWKLCIVCCDQESFTFFRREMIPCVLWQGINSKLNTSTDVKGGNLITPKLVSKVQQTLAPFGSEEFKKMNKIKLDILLWVSQQKEVERSLYLDGDIVVQKDPWPLLNKELDKFPVVFQCDCGGHNTNSSGPTEHKEGERCPNPCTGVIGHDHKFNFNELYSFDKGMFEKNLSQDQPYVQERLQLLSIPYNNLSRAEFGNGHWQMSGKWKTIPWTLLHYNFRVGDTKKQAMKKYGHWLLPY